MDPSNHKRLDAIEDAIKDYDEYRRKRERNNEAVKRSRVKSKQQTNDTHTRVKKLRAENQKLEDINKRLIQELELLKELITRHRRNSEPES